MSEDGMPDSPASEPEYGIVIAKDVMVPMRDGVRLATDIYFPAREGARLPGAFPAILGRTSYDKTAAWLWVEPVADFFTRRGYVVVLQDLRGRHQSEGIGQYFHTANPTEGPDGSDTIEWIAAQPWSNGRVGMTGSSHGGIVQQIAALHRPPHLTTIWPDVAPTNIHAHMSREGGAMALHMFGALFLHAHDAQELRDDPAGKAVIFDAMEHLGELVHATPFKPGQTPLRVVPNLERMLFEYYYRGAYDEFWAQDCCDQERYFDRHADIPATFSGGWFDPFAMATTNYHTAMTRQNRTPQRLLMGPWAHGSLRNGGTSVGDVDFGPDADWGVLRYDTELLRWFDRWLKGIENGIEDEPPVRIFVMGGGDGRKTPAGKLNHGGRWRAEREWPLARTRYTPYYFQPGFLLATHEPPAGAGPARFSYDPDHPVPTIGGAVTGFYELVPLPEGMNPALTTPRARMRSIVLDGPAHQQEAPGLIGTRPPYLPLAARPDVLAFQTLPLEQAIELTGPIVVNLWISSSAPDTDFTAKLVDVHPPNEDYPGGYHMNLCDSIIRCRFRHGFEREELMTPGEVYQVRIDLPPTSNLFQPGHCIRLDISSSNFPRFDLNPNTGEPLGRHTHYALAHNTVYLDSTRPSHVVLPVIPGN
jgi:putative CocE/NonD family hydrolase